MSDAIVRAKIEGAWQPISPVWSLSVEANEHGPDSAVFVTRRTFPKFTEVEILVGGLLVADGWIEQVESLDEGEDLYAVTVWCWQRHLDDDVLWRTWMLSGFERALDSRDAAGVNQAYWARAGLRLADRSLTLGIQPNTIWYEQQAAGATFDLGPGTSTGYGPRRVWLYQTANNFPSKLPIWLVARAHSTRSNHHPGVAGQAADSAIVNIAGDSGAKWRDMGSLDANNFRYLTVFLYIEATIDASKDAAEHYISFSEVRINTLGVGGGTPTSQNGSGITADMAVPSILQPAGRLTLRRNVVSTTTIYGLSTNGHQTPRQMLERIDLDQWRYRVNPGRYFDREPYPTIPTYTVTRDARARLRTPETYTVAVVPYRDAQGDEQRIRKISNPDRPDAQVIQIDSNAAAGQAEAIADAFLKDQAERRVEGSVTIAPGQVMERPSGQPIDPAQLLLAGGDRVWVDEAEDHARISRVTYDHDRRTVTLDLSELSDDLDRELAYLSETPT